MSDMAVRASQPAHTTRPFHFINLPPELRNQIYEYALTPSGRDKAVRVKKRGQRIGSPPSFSVLALLQTCKQVYDEAQGIFYDINTICMFDADLESFILTTSARRLHMIKTLTVYAPTGSGFETTFKLLQELKGLQHLRMSVRGGRHSSDTIFSDRRIKRNLESLAEHVPALRHFSLTRLGDMDWFFHRETHGEDKVTQVRLQRIIDGVRSRQGEVAKSESCDVP